MLRGSAVVELAAGPAMVVTTRDFSLGSLSALNVNSNVLVIDYSATPNDSPYGTLVDQLKNGLTCLGGTGYHGIQSTVVAVNAIAGTMMAVIDNGEPPHQRQHHQHRQRQGYPGQVRHHLLHVARRHQRRRKSERQ